jgi:hypothetical protein
MMVDRWIGVVVSGDKVTFVDAEVPDSGPLVLQSDQNWNLQPGDRCQAYAVMSRQVTNYATEHQIKRAVIKESAVSGGAATKALLHSAELRGVVMAALADVTETEVKAKASISKTFGQRTVDDYVADDSFWTKEVTGAKLRAGSREAALILLAARKSE